MNIFNFIKMEGLGNDFIISHEGDQDSIAVIKKSVSFLCDRRKGIGGDGVILILPSLSPHADFRIRIFNADCSEAEMCGNGIRCCLKYVQMMQLTKKQSVTFETGAGIIRTSIVDNELIKVNMGRPILDAPAIPTSQSAGKVIMNDLSVDDKIFKITAISMGNPHAIIFIDKITDELVHHWGPKIETNAFFPKRTNVEFARVNSRKEISMRVWERGCGETKACGTGACAVAVASIINTLCDNEITVHLPGGDLFISWNGNENAPVFMTGPANAVFKGSIEISG